jgi:cysteine desulfurase
VAALQSANGEVGTRQPLEAAWDVCRPRGIPLVVDAQAGLGRDPVPEAYDVLVGEARSWGGPAGVGVLVVPERTRWRRPGAVSEAEFGRTDAEPVVPLVLAAAEAWLATAPGRAQEALRAWELVDEIRSAAAEVPDTDVVGDPVERLPHVVTFSCLFVDGEALVHELDRRGFAVASGSACTASTLEPSHVLAAMGVLTHGNVRVTLPLAAEVPGGDTARQAGVEAFCAALPEAVAAVRAQLGTDRV